MLWPEDIWNIRNQICPHSPILLLVNLVKNSFRPYLESRQACHEPVANQTGHCAQGCPVRGPTRDWEGIRGLSQVRITQKRVPAEPEPKPSSRDVVPVWAPTVLAWYLCSFHMYSLLKIPVSSSKTFKKNFFIFFRCHNLNPTTWFNFNFIKTSERGEQPHKTKAAPHHYRYPKIQCTGI
jgi:hypothetical protein